MGLAFTAIGALIAEVVPLDFRGLAMGGYNTCIYLGMMLSSAVMGEVIQRIGFTGGYLLAGELKNKETVVEGIDQAVGAFTGLFEGKNVGKMVVKLA